MTWVLLAIPTVFLLAVVAWDNRGRCHPCQLPLIVAVFIASGLLGALTIYGLALAVLWVLQEPVGLMAVAPLPAARTLARPRARPLPLHAIDWLLYRAGLREAGR